MKILVSRILSCLVLVSLVTGIATAGAKSFRVRVHSQMPNNHYVSNAIELFIAEAQKLSKGTLEFDHYLAQQLYRDKQMVDVLPRRGVEVAQFNAGMFIGKVPETGLTILPATFKDLDHYFRFLYDHKKSGAGLVVTQAFLKKANIVDLGILLYSPNFCVITVGPVTNISDYKGKKIRAGAKFHSVILRAWGASEVIMSSSDVYMAMERGTIDGAFSGMTTFLERKWYEAGKYINVVDGLSPGPFSLGANLDFWNELERAQKRALIKGAYRAKIFAGRKAIAAWNESQKQLKSKGVKIHVWQPAEAKTLKDRTLPAILKTLIEKPLGKEMVMKVNCWIESTRDGNKTWEDTCRLDMEQRLSQIK